MKTMRPLQIRFLLLVLSYSLFAVGCSSIPAQTQPVFSAELTPYLTRTPAVTVTATFPPPPTATPTATPIVYAIVRGDTLINIAARNGITLDELMAANPGIQPDALVVGQSITIPRPAADMIITPVPVELSPVHCQPATDGIICLIAVKNPYDTPLENVILEANLYDINSLQVASLQVVPSLNLIPAHAVVPASVFFHGVGQYGFVRVGMNTSIRPDAWEQRYVQTELQNVLVSTAWDGFSADVQADVFLPQTQKPAADIRVVAVAYAVDGSLVGFRRVDWRGLLQPGESQRFTFSVYSLNQSIAHVELLVEANP